MNIDKFLEELRNSADIQYKIFTEGSCFRLYCILKTIFPKAIVYWSDIDGHAITKIEGKYYDIGGEINPSYVEETGYYPVPKNQMQGYKILKWLDKDTNLSVKIGKYKK